MLKVNISSLRVLQMLQLLFEKDYTMNELMAALSKVSNERCSNFLVSKYINTCRFCGIDIQKIDGKYTLLKLPFGMEFSDDVLSLFDEIKQYSANMRLGKNIRAYNSLLSKINKRSDRYYAKIEPPADDKNIQAFEFAIENGWKINMKLVSDGKETSILCEPLELSCDGDKLVIIVNLNGERTKILYDDVVSISVSDIKSSGNILSTSVIFRLRNTLARRYTLRPDEKVVGIDDDGSITVLNKTEDKQSLLNRLLKYDSMCELVSPRAYKKEMKSLIDNTLANYGK